MPQLHVESDLIGNAGDHLSSNGIRSFFQIVKKTGRQVGFQQLKNVHLSVSR